jgi:DKNYY family
MNRILVKGQHVYAATKYGEDKLALSANGLEVLFVDTESHHCEAWLKNADGYFYSAGGKVKKVPTSQLIVIDRDYAKNEDTVFWQNIPLPNSHPETFRVIDSTNYFAIDSNQLYALSGSAEGVQIWDEVDINSLVFFRPGMPYFADKHHLYYFNWHFIEYKNHFIQHENSDLTNHYFYHWVNGELVETDLTEAQKAEAIAREGTCKRYLQHNHPNPNAWWACDDAYYENLIPLKNQLFHDGENVYIRINKDEPSQAISAAGKDFFAILPDADLASLVSIDAHYSKDKTSVYHYQRKLKQADLTTFESLGNNFAKDKNGIFFNGYFCAQADAPSFKVINERFARDNTQLFAAAHSSKIGKFKGRAYLLCIMDNADADSFEVFNERWAKDNHNVYCYGKVWKQIDAATFEYLFDSEPNSWAKCKNGVYNANGRKAVKSVDGASFTALNSFWGKDKNAVFSFKTERIAGTIDMHSFEIINNKTGEAQDKKYCYYFDTIGNIKKKVRK